MDCDFLNSSDFYVYLPDYPLQEMNISLHLINNLKKEKMMAKPRTHYKYHFKVGNRIVHGGITNDIKRREAEHKQRWPKGHIKQVGAKVTEDSGRKWEKERGYS